MYILEGVFHPKNLLQREEVDHLPKFHSLWPTIDYSNQLPHCVYTYRSSTYFLVELQCSLIVSSLLSLQCIAGDGFGSNLTAEDSTERVKITKRFIKPVEQVEL